MWVFLDFCCHFVNLPELHFEYIFTSFKGQVFNDLGTEVVMLLNVECFTHVKYGTCPSGLEAFPNHL